jgi:mannose-6-phosphate isomerase-like protein (cupin superfamily)
VWHAEPLKARHIQFLDDAALNGLGGNAQQRADEHISGFDRLANSSDETVSQDLHQTMQQAVAGSANGTEAPPRQDQVRNVPAGIGPAYWGPGELMTFILTGEETGGAFFMADISVVPGGGTPPHIHHREDESFHLLEGHTDDSSGRGYNDGIAWRFCLPLPAESLIPSRTRAM